VTRGALVFEIATYLVPAGIAFATAIRPLVPVLQKWLDYRLVLRICDGDKSKDAVALLRALRREPVEHGSKTNAPDRRAG